MMYVTINSNRDEGTSARMSASPRRCSLIRQGTCLFYEGDPVERLYRIEDGVVRLTRVLEDGRRQVIAFGYPGDIVGFPADGLHHTDCEALTDTRVTSYARSALEDGCGDTGLHKALLAAALKEISSMQDHFMVLGRKSAAERVSLFLVVLFDRCGKTTDGVTRIGLPMTRADIADFLGLTTETVCRTVSALRAAGIIALDGTNTVILLDRKALKRRADGVVD